MTSAHAKSDYLNKENKFLRLTRRFDPHHYDAKDVLDNKKNWTNQISNALDSLNNAVDSLRLEYGTEVEATELKTFEDW